MANTLIDLMDDMHLSSKEDFLQFYDAMSNNNIDSAQAILANNSSLLNQIMNSENINKLITVINEREIEPKEDIDDFLNNLLTEFQKMVDNTKVLGAYDNTVQYVPHNFVYYNGKGYYCYKTPPIGTAPTNTSYWLEYDIRGLKGYGGLSNINFVGNWTSTQNYNVGDMVVYQNKLWYALAPNVNFAPNLNHYPWNLSMIAMPPNKTVIKKEEPEAFYYSEGDLWFKIIDGEDVTQLAWTEGLSDSQPRFASATFMIDNVIYVVGGHDITVAVTDVHEAYDTVTGTWSIKATYPIKVGGNAGFALNGLGYVIGGINTSLVYVDNVYSYNPATNTWTAKNNFPVATSPVTEVGVRNGVAYVGVGVTNTGINSSAIYQYNSTNDSWSILTNIPTLRVEAFTGIIGDKMVFIGGEKETGVADNTTEIYDFTTNTWTTGKSMPTARFLGGRMVHGENIYAVGGLDDMLYSVSKNEVYNIVDNTWKEDIPLLYAGNSLSSEYTDKYGYIIGGIEIQYAMINGRVQIYEFSQEDSSFEMKINTNLINSSAVSNNILTEDGNSIVTEDDINIIREDATSLKAKTVSIPMTEDGSYNYYIDWGDGNISSQIETYNDTNATHTYDSEGVYTIKLIGRLSRLKFTNEVAMALTEIIKCRLNLTNIDNMFSNCTNLISIPTTIFENSLSLTSAVETFSYCSSLKSVPAGLFGNNTGITNFERTFAYSGLALIPGALFSPCINATNFKETFSNCTDLLEIPLNLFQNNNAITSFNRTFLGCTKIISLPNNLLSYSPIVTTYEWMFGLCSNLTTLPENLFGNACASALTFANMFDNTKIKEIPVGLFQYATAATNFDNVFNGTQITSIPDNCFNANNATWNNGLNIDKLTSLGNSSLYGLQISNNMFENKAALKEVRDNVCWKDSISNISVDEPLIIFKGCSNLAKLGNLSLKTENDYDYENLLSGCSNLATLKGFFDNNNEATISQDFSISDCIKLDYTSLKNIIDSLVNLSDPIRAEKKTLTLGQTNINKLSSVDLALIKNKNWNYLPASAFVITEQDALELILRYTNMPNTRDETFLTSGLYYYIELLNNSDQIISRYAVNKSDSYIYFPINIPETEYYINITDSTGIIEKWVSKGISSPTIDADSTGTIFKNTLAPYKNTATSINIGMTQFDIKETGVQNITNMSSLFSGFSNLQSIYFSDSLESKVTNMSNMFNNCNKLVNVDFGTLSTSKVTDFSNIFASTIEHNLNLVTPIDFSSATKVSDMFTNIIVTSAIGEEETLGKAYPNQQGYTDGDFTLPKVEKGFMGQVAQMFYPINKGVSKIIDSADYRLVTGTEIERLSVDKYIYPYWDCISFVEVTSYDQALSLIKTRILGGENPASDELESETEEYYIIKIGINSNGEIIYKNYTIYKDNSYIILPD